MFTLKSRVRLGQWRELNILMLESINPLPMLRTLSILHALRALRMLTCTLTLLAVFAACSAPSSQEEGTTGQHTPSEESTAGTAQAVAPAETAPTLDPLAALYAKYGNAEEPAPEDFLYWVADVLEDMDVVSQEGGGPNELQELEMQDGAYVRYPAFETAYFITTEYNELVEAPELLFPMYYQAHEYEESMNSITGITVTEEAVTITVERMTQEFVTSGETFDITVTLLDGKWLFHIPGKHKKMRATDIAEYPLMEGDRMGGD